ncbi:DUF202 domain-containing protein [Saccharopolyspora rhizosphaerae]|uniref:DUF202 domain-containing protein n=1 Tax=Saccharopolyspora rhizosphaerae TaxID=2492662 RepID=A0A426JHR3_9PSEU|nr:DUF202 domain-containing protein [Saccharopolyspora rhizosphaerae]RRO12692.1 DUF202 domain-containing protein [Saccharopolyspora rhizosphaerae]
MSGDEPWDPGLQVERTTLAWLRTVLSFTVSLLVLLKLISHHSAIAAVVCALVTLPTSAIVGWLVWRRHHRSDRRLRAQAPLPGGSLPAATAVLSMLAGATGAVYVLFA